MLSTGADRQACATTRAGEDQVNGDDASAPVRAALLVGVHPVVGELQQVVRIGAARVGHRHPDARRDPYGQAVDVDRVGQYGAQPLGDVRGVDRVGDALHHEELVAVQPGGQVGVPGGGPDPARGLLQQHVAGLVPVGVVDLLEAVQVDQDHRDAAGAAALQPAQRLLQVDERVSRVRQTGQFVVRGLADQVPLPLNPGVHVPGAHVAAAYAVEDHRGAAYVEVVHRAVGQPGGVLAGKQARRVGAGMGRVAAVGGGEEDEGLGADQLAG